MQSTAEAARIDDHTAGTAYAYVADTVYAVDTASAADAVSQTNELPKTGDDMDVIPVLSLLAIYAGCSMLVALRRRLRPLGS